MFERAGMKTVRPFQYCMPSTVLASKVFLNPSSRGSKRLKFVHRQVFKFIHSGFRTSYYELYLRQVPITSTTKQIGYKMCPQAGTGHKPRKARLVWLPGLAHHVSNSMLSAFFLNRVLVQGIRSWCWCFRRCSRVLIHVIRFQISGVYRVYPFN